MSLLDAYAEVAGPGIVRQLRRLAAPLAGLRMVHVNSTRVGGGVAEILAKMLPLTEELGIETRWEVVTGEADYYRCTKSMHNTLQGDPTPIPRDLLEVYEETGRANAEALRPALADADLVLIHDPQPAPLLCHMPERKGTWVWRCHIDASRPQRAVWRFLERFVAPFDASVFSLADFAQRLPHPQYLIPPSIDPLADKNVELEPAEIEAVLGELGIDPERPLVVQVSRYDRFKDPVGVIRAWALARRHVPGLQLVLAGGGATDDPEGEEVLAEVREAAGGDPDVHVLLLPPDAHRKINALQRAAGVVIQKSVKEGFGLTVTEGLWKGKPVIGGNAGGIRLQVIDGQTGYLVNSPEGAARRIRDLLGDRERAARMGERGRELVRERFLLTRHLRDYLGVFVALRKGGGRVEL